MKTNTQLTALFLILSLMFATNTFALKRDIKFEEETYIDDIPFDTEWIVNELMNAPIDFEDEAYIDDIPFSTGNLVANYNYSNATSTIFIIEDENYVDDIPMNTQLVVNELSTVDFEDEANIDDIPFNTELVVKNYNFNNALQLSYEFNEEAYVDDIPFDTYLIATEAGAENNLSLFACGR